MPVDVLELVQAVVLAHDGALSTIRLGGELSNAAGDVVNTRVT